MLKIAIVGNIASGKSTVEDYIAQKGYVVYDTDKLSHFILNKFNNKIIEVFENFDILEDGKISRKKLGELVFSDSAKRKKLEDIIYPQLKQDLSDIFEEKCENKFVFISIPLLFEVGWENLFDKIIFVQSDDKIRLERLKKRNNLTENQAMQRLNSQKPQQEKIDKSDFIICNNDDIMSLQKQIDEIIILLEDME